MLMLGLCDDIVALVGQLRLIWHGYVMRKEAGVVGPGRPGLEWRPAVKDALKMELLTEDGLDRPGWRGGVRGFSSLAVKG